MKKILLIFILTLTASIVSPQSGQPGFQAQYQIVSNKSGMSVHGTKTKQAISDTQLEKWMEEAAKEFNVDPNFLKAVAHIESRKGNRKYRCGWIGKPVKKRGRIIYPGTYAGPMAIHYYYMDKTGLDISDPRINIWIGANALAGTGHLQTKQEARLRIYNKTCNPAYLKAVRQAKLKFAKGEL